MTDDEYYSPWQPDLIHTSGPPKPFDLIKFMRDQGQPEHPHMVHPAEWEWLVESFKEKPSETKDSERFKRDGV